MHHLLPIRVADEKQELLAPVTAEIIALPENGGKPPCELSQRRVTGTMAIRIVDLLEVIDIGHDHAEGPADGRVGPDLPFEAGHDSRSIQYAS
jgi:hypothetical protein